MLNEMLRETKSLPPSGKSQFSSVKKIICFILLTIGLTALTNAQGITNTLGGNTATEKFIVENSDSETGLVVTGEGDVGIGATSTGSKLYIEDSQSAGSNTPILTINNTAPSGQNMLDFQHNGTTQGRLRSTGGGSFWIENRGNSDIRMGTNDEVRMTIKNDGKVGIWTTSPSQMLEVNGKIKIGTDGSTPTDGTIRFLNGHFEGYDGSTWKQLDN